MRREHEQKIISMVHVSPIGAIDFSPGTRTAHSPLIEGGESPIFLSPLESRLIEALMKNPFAVLHDREFFQDNGYTKETNRFHVLVERLRRKLGDMPIDNRHRKFRLIHRIENEGYTLTSNDEIFRAWNSRRDKEPELLPNMYLHPAEHGDLVLFSDRHMAISPLINDGYVELEPEESQILLLFMKQHPNISGNMEIYHVLGGNDYEPRRDYPLIKIRIARLRKKLGDTMIMGKPKYPENRYSINFRLIRTTRFFGYSLY